MLQSAVRGATKTRLMYDAFLSHSQVEEYLSFLLGKKLISMAPDKKHYLPTEKGLRFLAMYDEIEDAVALERTQSAPSEGAARIPGDSRPRRSARPRLPSRRGNPWIWLGLARPSRRRQLGVRTRRCLTFDDSHDDGSLQSSRRSVRRLSPVQVHPTVVIPQPEQYLTESLT